MKRLKTLLFFVLLFSNIHAQELTDFDLNVVKTDETCLGNGTLTFSVSNITPSASLLYKVYLLPDITNPISIQEENYIGGLSAGSYRVVAMQAIGSLLKTKEKDITIINNIESLDFKLESVNLNCSQGGSIIITVLSGTASAFEIISGPVTRPLQSENVFENLSSGTYKIRVFDTCGIGKVKTYTLSTINNIYSISDAVYENGEAGNCNSLVINNKITPSSGTMTYPITVKHTLDAMDIGGAPIVFNQTITTGPEDALEVSAIMPRLADSYTYDIAVTDNCNAIYEKNGIVVDPDIQVSLNLLDAPCAEKYLSIVPSLHMPPYNVNFLSAPAGFNAADYNEFASGPFYGESVEYGSKENPLPFGDYVVEVTDACGRTATESITIEFIKPTPSLAGTRNNGCFSLFGRIIISIPSQKVVSATMLTAPNAYTGVLPRNLSNFVIENGAMVVINNLPIGMYTIAITDDCGYNYEVEVEIPPFVEKDFNIVALPACTQGYGGIRMRSGNGKMVQVSIISAPSAFDFTLPHDVTVNIAADGSFYMSDLAEGTYILSGTDICGIVKEMSVNVEGYRPSQNSFEFIPNCGSFSVKMTDNTNSAEGLAYWLQKYNPETQTWGHPFTGAVYSEGTVPNATSGIKLLNNRTTNNLNYTGKFRIVKKFETFSTGVSGNTICISVLDEFNYTDGLSISAAYSMACIGSPNQVYVEAIGYPIAYRVTHKNGAQFLIDNGNNNIFSNLEPAEYTFEIEDACGNIVTQWFNVSSLPSIAEAGKPDDMIECIEPGIIQNYEFHLTDQNQSILGPLHSAMYDISYHLTEADANNNVNPLPEYYTNLTNGQPIYVRLAHKEIPICIGTTSFRLYVGNYQEPKITTIGTICDNGSLTLTANGGYSKYLWSTGETTRSINVTEPGVYTVIVEKAYGNRYCDGYAEVEINSSETPIITKIETTDWTTDNNTITVYAEGAGNYQYSLDGYDYQDSNEFTNLSTGVYEIYVKDALGCGVAVKEVVLLNYPNYFTPNGDGIHDRWHIEYSILEPHMKIAIFDRYGKLITTFGSTHEGWDGTLNGIQLPSTDYWFVVTREDGRELKGHFSMLR